MYLGIQESGRLAAMAGERLRLDGCTEISAVCTHPDFRGKGYAPALIIALIERMTARRETPFLHVGDDNAPQSQFTKPWDSGSVACFTEFPSFMKT